jgi:hypothetical protein
LYFPLLQIKIFLCVFVYTLLVNLIHKFSFVPYWKSSKIDVISNHTRIHNKLKKLSTILVSSFQNKFHNCSKKEPSNFKFYHDSPYVFIHQYKFLQKCTTVQLLRKLSNCRFNVFLVMELPRYS